MVSNENMMRAMLATKQLEIDKLKRKIKEMENDKPIQTNTEVETTLGTIRLLLIASITVML